MMADYISEREFQTAPATYQEWLDCFRFIREHPENHTVLRTLSSGSVCFVPRMLDMFLQRLDELIAFLLPHYVEEGKTALVIAIGCTGGRHRSVAVACALAEFIRQKGYQATENHRDMTRA